ncbi:MAG: hypothetical protein E4H14_09830 [Candidatus Thorarchaeota archaeon]|nr:MAG: hypothetical protein E4H14_09830 [Candidatus Thorarchaeota archaeon]
MLHKQSNQRKTLRIICVLFVSVALVSSLSLNVTGQDTLTFSINRNVGMAFGNYISGTYTLQGSGPTSIQNMTVYFNGEQVHFVTGNTIAWQFNTANYEGGGTNVTLVGITDTGVLYNSSQTVVFIADSLSTLITIVIIALVAVLILAKYGPRLMRLRTK